MQVLTQLRWVLLLAALACGLAWGLKLLFPIQTYGMPIEFTIYVGAVLQALAVFAMSKHFAARGGKGGWPVVVGYAAAAFWLIALLTAFLSAGTGPGGVVYGIIIVLPAIGIAALLQIVALLGFAAKDG